MEELDILTIGRRSVHGVLALISRQFILQLISFAAFLLMASLFPKSDVGTYTVVIAIQRIINFFTDFGIGAALVQKKDELTQEDLMTSFTLQTGITFGIFILILFLSGPLATFFRLNHDGQILLITLVFIIFLSSFKTIPSILLERTIQFNKLIIPQIVESLTFNAIFVALLLTGHHLDSYTWAFLISALLGIPFYYWVSPWRVRIGISKDALHHLKFGLQFQGKNVLATIKDDMLTVMLSKLLAFQDIANIGFAQKLSFFAYRYIVDSVTKVSFSTYSRIQHDMHLMKKAIEKSLFFVSSSMFPILLGVIVTGQYLIRYFPHWHGKWETAYFSLVFFCLNAAVSALSGVLVNVLDATGRVKTTLQLMVCWTILTWILTPLLILRMGFNGVALASFLVTLTIFWTVYLVKKIVSFSVLGSIVKPVFATLGMGVVVFAAEKLFVYNFITLGIAVVLGGIVYFLLMALLARDEVLEGITYIRKRA